MAKTMTPARTVPVPRTYLDATKALALVGRAGGRYAVAVRRVSGLVGPLQIGDSVAADEVLAAVASAAGLELAERAGIPLLQAPKTPAFAAALADAASSDARRRRAAAYALGESGRFEALEPLSGALADADPSVRRAAVLALAALEGEFQFNQWPGRLSVFELPGVVLDLEMLLWLIEEGAEPGGLEWKSAASVLGRAREGELPRCIWWHAWNRRPGTIAPVAWAAGRCGDPDTRHMLDMLLRNPGTGLEADRYTVAAALGKLGQADRMARYAADSTAADVRLAVAYGLGFAPSAPVALETLARMVKDPDARVRETAALSLGRLDTDAAVELLTRLLEDEGAEAALRGACAQALARTSGESGPKALVAATKSAEASVRAAAAEALGAVGGKTAAGVLDSLLDDKHRRVAAAAGRALAALGSPDALPKLARTLTRTAADLEVRIAIAVGLGQSRVPDAARPLSKVALDGKDDRRLREYAVRSLAMLAEHAGQKTLRRLIESRPPARMTLLPLRFLDLGDPDATVDYLKWWLTHGDVRHEQVMAAERIGELGTAAGTRLLAGGSDVFDNHARWTHVWSLIQNDGPAVRAKLIELLRSRRRSLRINAAIALGGRRDPAVTDALIEACRDPDETVRMAAANSLGECGDPAAAPALVEMMEKDAGLGPAHHALRALRQREFACLPAVKAALDRVRGTERDCGIPGGPDLLDQGANTFVLRRWPLDYEDLSMSNITYESTIAYDSVQGRVVQWGSHGRRADIPQTGMTWVYDAKANRWRRATPRTEPEGSCCNRGMVFDPVRGLAIVPKSTSGTGGHGYIQWLRSALTYSVPWVFDVREEQWYPMRPLANPGSCGHVAACFDSRNDVAIFLRGTPQVYDAHANEWTTMKPPGAGPDSVSAPPGAYDPATGRFIVATGSDERGRARTWAYDLRKNEWTDLAPANPPPACESTPMVYDSANDVMLVFHNERGRVAVYAYHPRENRWEALPASYPAPSYGQLDAAYDARNNVTVLCGGWDNGCSGIVTVRETWTYRYKAGTSAAPLALGSDVRADGWVALAWNAVENAQGYHVYRGSGGPAWTVQFERLTETPIAATEFTDAAAPKGIASFYRVCAMGADGSERVCSNLVRTQPPPVREVWASRAADGSVTLTWKASAGPAIAGYNVYRAPMAQLDPWTEHFDPLGAAAAKRLTGEFVKLNADLVRETAWTDRPDDRAAQASETTWAPMHVYVVRAVNVLGVESGPSPATLSVAGPPGPVLVVPQEDGSRLVVSGRSESAPLAGYHLYRLDCYRGDFFYRFRGAPQPGAVFVDDEDWPTGDRRAYYVTPVDELGQLGTASSAGWGHAMP